MRKRKFSLTCFIFCLAFSLIANTLSASHAHAASSIVGYWKLDEGSGTTATDASGNSHSGTLQGGASWTAGQEGSSSISLNGSNSYVDIPGAVVNTTQSYTASAWVKLNSLSGYQTFVSIDGSQISGFYLQLRGDTGKFAFTSLTADSTSANTDFASSTSAPVTGTWYHLTGVYDASAKTLSLYVNGSLQQTISHATAWQATGDTEIGRGKYSGNPVDFVNGQVDDVRLYNTALSAQQIQDVPTVGYWPFDENSGTTANDSSPNSIAGTITGATWTTGHSNSALAFNGTSNSVSMGNPGVLNFGTGSFTVASWFKTSATDGFHRIVSKGHYGWTNGYFMGVGPYPTGNAGGVGGGVGAGGNMSNSLLFYTTSSFNDGNWHLAIMVINRSSGTAQIYVDGQAQAVTTQSGTCGTASGTTINISACSSLNASSSDPFTVGSYNGTAEFYNGSIDDLRAYPYAMGASAVGGLFNNNPIVPAAMTIQANQAGAQINPELYGLMFEDISHSGDGGLYAELIRNRTFKDDPSTPVNWSAVTSSGAQGSIALDTTHQVNSTALTTSLKLQIDQVGAGQRVGVANTGFWGIPVRPFTIYRASFYAQVSSDFRGPLTVDIESNDGSTIYAKGWVLPIGTSWKQYSVILITGNVKPSEANRFVISAGHTGTVWLNQVSLFPPTWNNRTNGLRPDLMKLMNDMKPGFLRFPGGNYLEGYTTSDYFNWKNTIGDLSQRPGHNDPWGYRSSDGLGLLEYLEWCEDLHMSPLLAVYAGFSLNGTHIAVGTTQFNALVQDALDEIQYATGGTNTTWGARRAADGHPKPFSIQYVEVGNEDWLDRSGSYNDRFAAFYDAIRAAYPNIKLIATTSVTSRTPDVYDDHYYLSPAGMEGLSTRYDNYSRGAPKIFVGEYAAQEGNPTPDLNSALGDASFMTGLERNADVVSLASYAPLFVNVNAVNWGTNLIGFDALNSYGSPSYYVQKLFSLYHGDVVLPTQLSGGMGTLYFVTSKVSNNGTVYVKVVNTAGFAQKTQMTINGAKSIAAHGNAIVLSSASARDTNTLSNPNKVVPITQAVNNISSSFSYTFPPYSVTILQLKLS
jgi:alpha-L-arabinofuranosidase